MTTSIRLHMKLERSDYINTIAKKQGKAQEMCLPFPIISSYLLTTLMGLPLRNASMFFAVVSIMR